MRAALRFLVDLWCALLFAACLVIGAAVLAALLLAVALWVFIWL